MKKTDLINSLDSFTRSYLNCILWAENDNSDEQGGEPLDAHYDIDDFTKDSIVKAIEDCKQFQADNAKDLEFLRDYMDSDRAGHNFWLNRNGHGSGFWDEYMNDKGAREQSIRDAFNRLSDACKPWGTLNAFVYKGRITVE